MTAHPTSVFDIEQVVAPLIRPNFAFVVTTIVAIDFKLLAKFDVISIVSDVISED